MNKNIRAVMPPDKSIAFGVVKPFHCTAHVCWAPRPGDSSLSFGENPADGSLRGLQGVYQKRVLRQPRQTLELNSASAWPSQKKMLDFCHTSVAKRKPPTKLSSIDPAQVFTN
jgi:hypothetical protein